jgi:hypothetical protein
VLFTRLRLRDIRRRRQASLLLRLALVAVRAARHRRRDVSAGFVRRRDRVLSRSLRQSSERSRQLRQVRKRLRTTLLRLRCLQRDPLQRHAAGARRRVAVLRQLLLRPRFDLLPAPIRRAGLLPADSGTAGLSANVNESTRDSGGLLMSSGKGRHWIPWAWAIVVFAACGGTVVESSDDDDGGPGGGPSPTGGSSGAGAAVGRGGRGAASGASGRGGGPAGGRAGSAGYGGGAGYGGSGPICMDQGCGPSGTRCCQPGTGCGVSGPGPNGGYTCSCIGGIWSCSDPSVGDGTCPPGACSGTGLVCCRGRCVNLQNDPYNCGSCGRFCGGYCDFGSCGPVPCFFTQPLDAGLLCCGNQICGSSADLCCSTQSGGAQRGPYCHTPSAAEPTCPIGCPNCF